MGIIEGGNKIHRDVASDKKAARVQNGMRGLQSSWCNQSAPDSVGGRLARECRKLFDNSELFFENTASVLLNPTNCRFTVSGLPKITIPNWEIIPGRVAAIEEQDALFAGTSVLMQLLMAMST